MADAARKIISGNSVNNGAANLQKLVGIATIPSKMPSVYQAIDVNNVDTKYNNRFDDINYYTHSGAF